MSALARLEPILEGLSEDRIRQVIDFARFLAVEQDRQEWLRSGEERLRGPMARMSPITVRRTYGRIASHEVQSRRRGSDTALPILRRAGQLRPALLLASLPGPYQTQLVCGVSTQLHQQVPDWDELIQPGDRDFPSSGLHRASIIRLSYLHATDPTEFAGAIGQVDATRLDRR